MSKEVTRSSLSLDSPIIQFGKYALVTLAVSGALAIVCGTLSLEKIAFTNIASDSAQAMIILPSALLISSLICVKIIQNSTPAAALQKAIPKEAPPLTEGELAYNRMVKGARNFAQIDKAVEEMSYDRVYELLKAMETPWISESSQAILRAFDLPYVVFKGVKEGMISEHQAGTLILFHTTHQLYEQETFKEVFEKMTPGKEIPKVKRPKTMPLFSETGIKEESSWNLLRDNLVADTPHGSRPYFLLKPEQFAEFESIMRKLPKSEQQFLLVSDALPATGIVKNKDGIDVERPTIAAELNKIGMNVLGRVQLPSGEKCFIVPSVGMMNAYLQAKFGEEATKMRIRCCEVSPATIARDWEEGFYHVLGIPCSLVEANLSTSDGYFSPGYYFPWHDFYHCIMSSAVPHAHKKLYVKIWKKMRERGVKRFENFGFIDMEHIAYSKHPVHGKNPREDCFWRTCARICSGMYRKTDSDKHKFESIVLEVVYENRKEAAECGISIENLLANADTYLAQDKDHLASETLEDDRKRAQQYFLNYMIGAARIFNKQKVEQEEIWAEYRRSGYKV